MVGMAGERRGSIAAETGNMIFSIESHTSRTPKAECQGMVPGLRSGYRTALSLKSPTVTVGSLGV